MDKPPRYFAQPLEPDHRGPRGARVLSSRSGQDGDTVFEVCRCGSEEDADKVARALSALDRIQEMAFVVALP